MQYFLAVFAIISLSQAHLSCRDEDGNEVDWFVAVKPPRDTNSTDKEYWGGRSLYILDSRRPYFLRRAANGVNPKGALGLTLGDLYGKTRSATVTSVIINDQWPDTEYKQTFAHMKATVAIDSADDSAIWLQHSVPQFPFATAKKQVLYDYPYPQSRYGQDFLCISVSGAEASRVAAEVIRTAHSLVNEAVWGTGAAERYSDLYKVVTRGRWTSSPVFMQSELHSRGGRHFDVFMKSAAWASQFQGPFSFWAEVGARLVPGGALYVQSWLNGHGGVIGPYCARDRKEASVMDVGTTQVKELRWSHSIDHSKWAVGEEGGEPVVFCSGDINRMYSQNKRGGGAICIRDGTIAGLFRVAIKDLADRCE